MDTITVRHMNLPFPDAIEAVVLEGRPEESAFFLGFSLLMPHLEPYLIRTMKAARPHISDPKLTADLAHFNAQEGQHYRQHARFNELVRERGYPRLASLEQTLSDDYHRFSREKPLRFNLAYAEGFEAFTTATARFSFEEGLVGMEPHLRDLYQWHLVEEFEHRTVAFDVYEHVVGDYAYRLRVGLYAQFHMLRFCLRAATHILRREPEEFARHGGWRGWTRRQIDLLRRALRGLVPKVWPTYLPGYTPHDIAMPEEMSRWQERYTAMAVRTSGGPERS